jgi:hypothetical protein
MADYESCIGRFVKEHGRMPEPHEVRQKEPVMDRSLQYGLLLQAMEYYITHIRSTLPGDPHRAAAYTLKMAMAIYRAKRIGNDGKGHADYEREFFEALWKNAPQIAAVMHGKEKDKLMRVLLGEATRVQKSLARKHK